MTSAEIRPKRIPYLASVGLQRLIGICTDGSQYRWSLGHNSFSFDVRGSEIVVDDYRRDVLTLFNFSGADKEESWRWKLSGDAEYFESQLKSMDQEEVAVQYVQDRDFPHILITWDNGE